MRTIIAIFAILLLSACGASRYDIMRTSASVEFEEGTWSVLPLQGSAEGHVGDALVASMVDALHEDAAGYRFVRHETVESGSFGVRVTIESLRQEADAHRLDATVAFVDSSGAVPDEIRVSLTMPADGSSAPIAELGEELGRRTAHFIHSREHHHY